MRIIALANQKGGVGKTTSTVNLAGMLSEMGYKVMLIDLDPQAHMTTFLGIGPDEIEQSSYSVLMQSVPLESALIQVRENISLLASELNLAAAEQELVSVVGRETILRDALAAYGDKCDFVFIDCPPSLGLLTLNALGAATEVFIPLQAHFLSLQGLSQLLESLLLVQKRINPTLKVTGLLFCMYDARTMLSGEIVSDIEGFFDAEKKAVGEGAAAQPWSDITIFKTRIRRNVKLAESPSYGKMISEYEPNCNGTDDYRALAEEIAAMAGTRQIERQDVKEEPVEVPAEDAVVEENVEAPVAAEPAVEEVKSEPVDEPVQEASEPIEERTPIVPVVEREAEIEKPFEEPPAGHYEGC